MNEALQKFLLRNLKNMFRIKLFKTYLYRYIYIETSASLYQGNKDKNVHKYAIRGGKDRERENHKEKQKRKKYEKEDMFCIPKRIIKKLFYK